MSSTLDWIDQATSIAPSEIKALDELVYQMGLRLRLGKPITESLEQFEVIRPSNIPALTGAVEALAHETDAKELAESWNGLTAQLQGMMMVAAKIRLGDQAPESWQNDARRILFATERPALISSE